VSKSPACRRFENNQKDSKSKNAIPGNPGQGLATEGDVKF
jgi:hypothetical protein